MTFCPRKIIIIYPHHKQLSPSFNRNTTPLFFPEPRYDKVTPCPICGRPCNMYKLRRHMDLVHFKIRRFKCIFCEKKFGTNNNRKLHMKKYHGYLEERQDNTAWRHHGVTWFYRGNMGCHYWNTCRHHGMAGRLHTSGCGITWHLRTFGLTETIFFYFWLSWILEKLRSFLIK